MTNFDYLNSEPQFHTFAPVAISAEKIAVIDPSASIINCRRAMEFAIKWMYSVDKALVMPYQDNLVTLLHTEEFKDLMDDSLWRRLDFIRRMGNQVAHTGKPATLDQAKLCLKNLFLFMDFVSYCYGENYQERKYDESLLEQPAEIPEVSKEILKRHQMSLKLI